MVIEDIIRGCKEGDRKCQDALVHTYAPVLMAICIRYTRDHESAKDCLQESYINIFQHIHSFRGVGSFEGWMKRISVRNCLAYLRKSNKYSFEDITDNEHLVPASISDVHSQMNVQDILLLINSLPDSLSTVFNLYIVDGYDHKEISEMLGIAESTSRAALSKARTKLVEKMSKSESKIYQWAAAL